MVMVARVKGATLCLIPNLLFKGWMFLEKFSTFYEGFAFCILFCISMYCLEKQEKYLVVLPGIILMPVCYLVYCPSIKTYFGMW